MSLSTRIAAELRGDRVIWAIIVLLGIISVLAVYSATGTIAYRERGGVVSGYLFKHLIILGGGLVVVYLCHLFSYVKYSRWAPTLLLVAIGLLLLTMFFGVDINGARRWLKIPLIGLTFQTSDFAKVALIIYVARSIGSRQNNIKDFKEAFLPIIIPVVVVCGLIAVFDLSSAALIFLICLLMMVIGRVAFQYIMMLLLTGITVFSLMVVVGRERPDLLPRAKTWEKRIGSFFNRVEASTDDVYQIEKSKIAIANGGLIGEGPGNSTQRNYLPSPYADFIFSIIVEEYGALGGIMLIGLYLLLFFRVVRLVTNSPKTFGAMVALGLCLAIILQAYINIGVCLDLLPVTGLTLPLVSMGGTSTLFTCIAFGIILSVSKYIETTAA